MKAIWRTQRRSLTTIAGIKNAVSVALKDFRGTLIEQLGRRMNKTDAEILNKYLQKIIAPVHNSNITDSNKPKIENNVHNTNINTLPEPFPKKKDLISDNSSTNSLENELEMSLLHPIFGQMVSDLGYKKVYTTNVRRLSLSPVWEKQRILRPERSAKIANAMKSKSDNHHLRLPGVISMYYDSKAEKYGIVDGQHRVGALILLAQQGLWNDISRNIMIDVFHTNSEDEIISLFKEINSAEPVRLIDLDFSSSSIPSLSENISNSQNTVTGTQGGTTQRTTSTSADTTTLATTTTATSSDMKTPPVPVVTIDIRSIITEGVEELAKKYVEMFKTSSRCRPPHLNIDVLRDDLYQAEFVQKHNIKSSKQLLEKLESINQNLSKKYTLKSSTDSDENNTSKLAAREKACKFNFFLGLDNNKEWINSSS